MLPSYLEPFEYRPVEVEVSEGALLGLRGVAVRLLQLGHVGGPRGAAVDVVAQRHR